MHGIPAISLRSNRWRWPSLYLQLILALHLLAGFATDTRASDWLYTVRPGDNLWQLSQTYLLDVKYYTQLQTYNGIEDPLNLPPGVRLKIPIAWLKRQPASVTVEYVLGQVTQARDTNSAFRPLTQGDKLQAGATIKTDVEASARLRFADGTRLTLQPGSELVLDVIRNFAETGMVDTRLRLLQGATDNRVQPLRGPASRYQITSPAAVSAVRGTHLRSGYSSESETARVELLSGSAMLTAAEQTVDLIPGFGSLAKKGEPPTPPRRLLEPPDLSMLPSTARPGSQLIWEPLSEAVNYRVQLYSLQGVTGLVSEKLLTATQFILPAKLTSAEYSLRVRGIDDLGLEGLDAEHQLTLNAAPPAPKPLKPDADTQGTGDELVFSWQSDDSTTGTLLEVAQDPEFKQLVLQHEITRSNQFDASGRLAPRDYYWRLSHVSADGERSDFSQTLRFTLKEEQIPPQPLVIKAVKFYADRAIVSWSTVEGSEGYQFQLALDPDFTLLVVDEAVAETWAPVILQGSDSYYFRVRSLHQPSSEFTPPHRLQRPRASAGAYPRRTFGP